MRVHALLAHKAKCLSGSFKVLCGQAPAFYTRFSLHCIRFEMSNKNQLKFHEIIDSITLTNPY